MYAPNLHETPQLDAGSPSKKKFPPWQLIGQAIRMRFVDSGKFSDFAKFAGIFP
jgi:hypothetical protein